MKINTNMRKMNLVLVLVFSILMSMMFIGSGHAVTSAFQMEWGNTTSTAETWVQINLTNTYVSPIVVINPEYTTTTNANGISTWVTNVTSESFYYRTTDENFASADNIQVHYIVMEEGNWTLPGTNQIKVEAGRLSTNKVGSQSGGWVCGTHGETVDFTWTFDNNPLVISTRGSDNNPSAWAVTFQGNPADTLTTVTTTQMCLGLSQSKALTPAAITNNETIYWLAMDEGNGTLSDGTEFEILWNAQDTGDSGGNWINGFGDTPPFTESWAHTWIGAPNLILGGATTVTGTDGGWPVIYDTGNTASIRIFIDEANERAHTGSESGGGWAFNNNGSISEVIVRNENLSFNDSLIIRTNRTQSFGFNVSLDAQVSEPRGNFTVVNVTSTIYDSVLNSTYNVSLTPEINNITYNSSDAEVSTTNHSALGVGNIIGESGQLTFGNRTSRLIEFNQTYTQRPVVIAVTASANNDNNPYIPIIHSINTTHVNMSLCRDAGATTCDNNYVNETVNFAVFNVDEANAESWIHVGWVNSSTDGASRAFTFGKTFSNAPYIFALPQTYNIGGPNIAAHSWFPSTSTTGANMVACDHPDTAGANEDNCAGTATEEFGYVAIDPNNIDIYQADIGTEEIANSAWTAITFARTFNNANVFVMVNAEAGGQDPKYPWTRSITTTGADIRYCEIDGSNDCDTHNAETTRWLALENGSILTGNGVADNEANATAIEYDNVLPNGQQLISNLTVHLNVQTYSSNGSTIRANNNPDLRVEIKNNQSEWIDLGLLGITGTGSYSLFTVNETVLTGWRTAQNTDIRFTPVFFDYITPTSKDLIVWDEVIVEVDQSNYTGRWSSIFNHTTCGGYYNVTDLYSTSDINYTNQTSYTDVISRVSCNPLVTLIAPANNSIVPFSADNVTLFWNVSADYPTVSCELYSDGVLNRTFTCATNTTLNISLNVTEGYHNWTINATDSGGLSDRALEWDYLFILSKVLRITKEITSIGNNLYGINMYMNNSNNYSVDTIIPEVVNSNFTAGSFTPSFDLNNTLYGPNYFGTQYLWNLTVLPNSNNELNYSVTGINDYEMLDLFIVGLD